MKPKSGGKKKKNPCEIAFKKIGCEITNVVMLHPSVAHL
jgi:hypothetical protein